MCRILVTHGQLADTPSLFTPFGELAESGIVPSVAPPGHQDGWGVAAFKNGDFSFLRVSTESAHADPLFPRAVELIAAWKAEVIIGHLRKASVGNTTPENTQPFARGNYAFCHNGTLKDSERIPLEPEYASLARGTTDSELIFLSMLQRIEARGDFVEGTVAALRELRELGSYTALNIAITDGKQTIVVREVAEDHPLVTKYDLCDAYYSLYVSEGASSFAVSSEPVGPQGGEWRLLPNHVAAHFSDGAVEMISLEG